MSIGLRVQDVEKLQETEAFRILWQMAYDRGVETHEQLSDPKLSLEELRYLQGRLAAFRELEGLPDLLKESILFEVQQRSQDDAD